MNIELLNAQVARGIVDANDFVSLAATGEIVRRESDSVARLARLDALEAYDRLLSMYRGPVPTNLVGDMTSALDHLESVARMPAHSRPDAIDALMGIDQVICVAVAICRTSGMPDVHAHTGQRQDPLSELIKLSGAADSCLRPIAAYLPEAWNFADGWVLAHSDGAEWWRFWERLAFLSDRMWPRYARPEGFTPT